MRPKIPNQLAQRIEEMYEEAGYATESELVRDAIRRRLEEIGKTTQGPEQEQAYSFEYELTPESELETQKKTYPTLYVRPKEGQIAQRDMADSLLLQTDSEEIEGSQIKKPLEKSEVVHTCALTMEGQGIETDDRGWIYIVFEDESLDDVGLDTAVANVFEALEQAIEGAESYRSPRQELENQIEQYIN